MATPINTDLNIYDLRYGHHYAILYHPYVGHICYAVLDKTLNCLNRGDRCGVAQQCRKVTHLLPRMSRPIEIIM